MSHTRFVIAVALTLALAPLVSSAGAQAVPHQNVLSFNPFGIFGDYYTGEYERTIGATGTFGIAATHIRGDADTDDLRWTSADVKYRFYPNATPLRGFSFGATAGYLRYSAVVGEFGPLARETDSTPTLGLEVSYQWLIGVHDNFAVGMGLGAKRLLTGLDVWDAPDDASGYFRFNVGYAF